MESLQDEISAVLWTLGKSELINVCQYLKISESTGGFSGQSCRALIQLAESTLDEIGKGEESQVFQQYVSGLQSFIQTLPEHASDKTTVQQTECSEIERLKQEYIQLQQAQAEARQLLEKKIEALGTQLSSTTVERRKDVSQPQPLRSDFEKRLPYLGSNRGGWTEGKTLFHQLDQPDGVGA